MASGTIPRSLQVKEKTGIYYPMADAHFIDTELPIASTSIISAYALNRSGWTFIPIRNTNQSATNWVFVTTSGGTYNDNFSMVIKYIES